MALTEAVNPAGVGVVIEATWVLVGVANEQRKVNNIKLPIDAGLESLPTQKYFRK